MRRNSSSPAPDAPTVRLKPGHVQPLWAGHPWVYAQAIDHIQGEAGAGDEVRVVDPRGNLLGRGFFSPGSAIPVRLLVRDDSTQLDGAFFRSRLQRCTALRQSLGLPDVHTNGFRLVNAEGDGLPGLIVDVYGDVVAVQLGTVGMKKREATLHEALSSVLSPRGIIDRTSIHAAKSEGFVASSGSVWGEDVRLLEFRERGLLFRIPLEVGQKTGFYFDQRALRGRVEQLSEGKRVLDAYCFVGAFAISAARGGASEVVAVDESGPALEAAAECATLNHVGDRVRFVKKDARLALQETEGEFDLIVTDPPRFAPSRAARDQAQLAYAKLAENVCRATRAGGMAVLCSCSAAIDLAALTRALATGAARARREAIVLERWFQGFDHPLPAAFAEGLYLKALVARIEAR